MNRQHNGQRKKGQKDKQRSTKQTHKANDRVTRTPLKIGGGGGGGGRGVNSGAPVGWAVPAPPVASHSLSRVVVPTTLHSPLSMLILPDFCKI